MKLAKERRIGATDASKLLGLSKYGGPLDVYRRIVEGVDTKSNPRMERGKKYEPEVRRRYVEQTGAEMQQFVMPLIVEHPTLAWATCSPDDVTVDDVLAEYKTTSLFAKGWAPVPVEYVIQVQWSLWVTGLERAHLYAAFGRDEPGGVFSIERCQLYEMRRDDELAETFAEVGDAFWRNHILTKTPPTETENTTHV